jgi:murein DD-endopeptidase MepM/ murein hydrolase activator NlpD
MAMGPMSRLRTVAGTFLMTSLLWGAGLVWWRDVQPQPVPQQSSVGLSAPQAGGASAARRPVAIVTPDPADIPPLVIPVQGVQRNQLIDTFTQARENGARVHDAIDIPAPVGTPVLVAADGTVEKLFTSAAGGITVYIRCDDRRFIHYYAHLDHYAPGLAEGQRVTQGQEIGAVGFTGNANPAAPHLHFAIQVTTPQAKWYEPSLPINPYPLLLRR